MNKSRHQLEMTVLFFSVLLLRWQCQVRATDARETNPRPKLSVAFPENSRHFLLMRSLVALPDDSLLLGDVMGDQPPTRVVLSRRPRVFPLPLPDSVYDKDIKSLAVVNEQRFLMTTSGFVQDHDLLHCVHLSGDKKSVRRVENVQVPDQRQESVWLVVAAGPRNGTFLLSGRKLPSRKSFVDVITADGQWVDTVIDDLDFQVTSMVCHEGDVYMMTGWSYGQPTYNLHKVNLASKTLSTYMGDLDMTTLRTSTFFFQGSFDSRGNLYVAAYDRLGCDEGQGQCCRCVMVISREGEGRVVLNYSEEDREVNAVLVTSSGFAVSSSVVEGYIARQVAVDVYDLVM